ncbi:MAG: alpha-1,3/4-fucosidase [Saprospiraceae bacterium]|nr:alpha-1,3/4-fucosidase [Saprospiraceae bacterium]
MLQSTKPLIKRFLILLFSWTFVVGYGQVSHPISASNTIAIAATDDMDLIVRKAAHVVPTTNQYEALKNEFIAFIHFGPNTFTRMEWGNGMEDPSIFDLKQLDTDQWCQAMQAAEMKMVILTVKHHDGFVLWQSRYTKHGVMSSPFEDGKGDVLQSLSKSCQKYGLKLGIYLSPADLHQIENEEGLYGNLSPYTERTIPRPVAGRSFENQTTFTFSVDDYNEYFLNQLFELLTEYGPIHEVWFDGAHPKRKGGQKYNYLAWKELINALAPEAVIFGKQDIRWCGNESGRTRDTECNVIPYQQDPNQMNSFADLTAPDLGSRTQLSNAKHLHYQQAETNTSIREGWFYRDDDKQRVRSADDVFDMYERSVGGNSTFLLNIPPNREGKFSPSDVRVLKEVGERIRKTYGKNLLTGAAGPTDVLDDYLSTSHQMNDGNLVISTTQPTTINRFVVQEAIRTHSERIEQHALEAWIEGAWRQIAEASNVGYKRILRFPPVTSAKFRIQVLQARLQPAIAHISAHYYKAHPPQLSIHRDVHGMVTIAAQKDAFYWKPHGEDPATNLNAGYQIRYTTDGSIPDDRSAIYSEAFLCDNGPVQATAQMNNELGSIASQSFGPTKANWILFDTSNSDAQCDANLAFDANEDTYWKASAHQGKHQFIAIDLGKTYKIRSFTYTPPQQYLEGMIEKGVVKISTDGTSWEVSEPFKFGNLINDPTTRQHEFSTALLARYLRIESIAIAGGGKSAAIAELDFLLQ